MIKDFIYNASPMRVIFGTGSSARLPQEIARLGAKKALVLCTPGHGAQATKIGLGLGEHLAGVYADAVMHVPIEIARDAREAARRLGADCLVAFGGGSTTGLAKAIALESGLPIVAIPTTYAGSEMTSIHGITEGELKRTGKDFRVLPRTVIYDPQLSASLPLGIAITSGFNAIAHAVEGLYAQDNNPMMGLIGEEGIRAMASSIAVLGKDPGNLQARADALYGAWLCGTVLGNVGMALHHKLCHTLGGTFNLPHAETHTVILPHALAYNAQAIPAALDRMRRALASDEPAIALYELALAHEAPTSLQQLGMSESDLDRAADIAVSNPYWNPRPVERTAIRALLQRAWEGSRPVSD
jgi:alcohol dehydrogenase class IV